MSDYWSVAGHFSFHRRAYARLFFYNIHCLVLTSILLQSICPAQSSTPDLTAGESLYQRWLPSHDSSSPDPRKLLEKIGQQKRSPSDFPEVPLPNPGTIPRDGNALPKELPSLTPAQLKQLRQIAEQYVKDGNPPFKAEDLDRLPPKLLEQIKKSPELQQIAKELAERSLANENEPADDAGNVQDPFAPAPPASSSNAQQRSLEPNASSRPNSAKNSGDPSSASKSGKDKSVDGNPSEPKSSNGNPSQLPSSNRPDPQPSNDAGQNANNRPSPSTGELNRSDEKSGMSLPNVGQPSQPSTNQSPPRTTPNANNPQFRPRSAGDETNRPQRNGPSSKNPSMRSPGSSLSSETGPRSATPSVPIESAVEKIQRKFKELGFGKAMEKIAKEAAGLEQSENANRSSSTASKNANNPNSSLPSNATRPSKTQPKEAPLATTTAPKKTTASSNDYSRQNSNRATAVPRTPSDPSQVSTSTETSTPFELPKLEFPKFSIWWIIALLSILVCGIALWMLSKDPIVASKVFGIKPPTLGSAEIVTKDIRTRADVVEVFHRLIETKFRSFEHWWTSRRALQQVDKSLPSLIPPMREAAEIYEMARYLPSDQELSDSDLQRMRQAMEKCALTGVLQ